MQIKVTIVFYVNYFPKNSLKSLQGSWMERSLAYKKSDITLKGFKLYSRELSHTWS